MATRKLSPGKLIILLLGFVFLLGIGTLTLLGKRMLPSPYACRTQTLQTFPRLAGAHFTVTHTQCEDYTHKQFVSVYVQRFVAPAAPFYAHWFNKPALLFRYHPENADSPLPVLTQSANHAVQISIPRVWQVDDRRRQWLSLTIHYRIGHVDHPRFPGNQ